MNRQFGLKFMLADHHELVVQVSADEAEKLAAAWYAAKANGQHRAIRGSGAVNGERWDWWLWTGDIVAMHTFWVFEQEGMPGNQWNFSGRN